MVRSSNTRGTPISCALLGATLIKQQKAGDAEEPLKLAARLVPNHAAAHEGLAEVVYPAEPSA